MTSQAQRAKQEDTSVIALARDGDARAVDQLVRSHWKEAYAVAKRIVPCHEDAEEVAQDSMCAAIRHLHALRNDAAFCGWLHRIVVNHSLMAIRRKDSRVLNSAVAISDGSSAHCSPAPRTPEELLLAAERRRVVEEGLARLHAPYSVVLRLIGADGLSVSEVAESLGISQGAVKIRLHRGRRCLHSEVARAFGTGDLARFPCAA